MTQTELPSTPTHTIYLLRVLRALLLLLVLLQRASLALPRQGQTSSAAAA